MATPENPTSEQLLQEVNRAIYTVMVGGQSYKIGNRSLTRADLAMLQKMRADLEAQIASGTSSEFLENTYVAVFDGR
jgi:hypothetical protein